MIEPFLRPRRAALIAGAAVIGLATSLRPEKDAGSGDWVALFDGKSLDGWDGDPRFWRVEDGAIVGETTESNKAPQNTFLISKAGEFGDFELQLSFEVEGYNSGVQYRSVRRGNWVVSGYQCDFEARWHDEGTKDLYSGMFFEEGGRMFLAQRGDCVIVRPPEEGSKEKAAIEKLGTVGDAAEIEKGIRRDAWNELTVVARGNTFIHILNGRVAAVAVDEDVSRRRDEGIIALQLHAGPPMKIRVKGVRLRRLH